VTWTFSSGPLRLLANFGDGPVSGTMDEGTRVLWSSPGIAPTDSGLQLPPWTAIIMKGTSA
jgi:maltooligosyltrehalose trehalohydrolase